MMETSLDKIKEYVRDAMSFENYEEDERPEGLRAELMEVVGDFFTAKRMSNGKIDNVKERFKDYMMGLPSIFNVHFTNEGQEKMLREWGIRAPKDCDDTCDLFCERVASAFFSLCRKNDIDIYDLNK